jgi:hypothetical protein
MVDFKNSLKKISFIYLVSVPVLVTALAFIVGHVNYFTYVPIWLVNAVLMGIAVQKLSKSTDKISLKTSLFFIFPWMLYAIFGGMGPPPESAAEWALQATEQVFRYTFLIIGGISMSIGIFRLNKMLAYTSGSRYAKWSSILIRIALPLFILNMAYWGYFLTNVFITYSMAGSPAKPSWMKSIDQVFTIIRMVEVALFYLATACLSVALRLNNQLSKAGSLIYVVLACLGALLNVLPSTIEGPLAIASYLSYIPAFTMLMPYLIAVNLLAKSEYKNK